MPYMMWLLTWIGMVLGAATASIAEAPTRGVAYQLRIAAGVRVHVVTVDMRNAELMVRPAFAWGEPGHGQSFASFLAHHRPLAQITGGYFSPGNWLPIGDIVIDGRLHYQGGIGSALAVRTDNVVEIRDIPRGGASWMGYETVLRGGLRLLRGGKLAIAARRQGFRDPALFGAASRTAVGLAPRNRLLLVATSAGITLTQLTAVMKGLGCIDAMTLDGGSSTGLAVGASIILTPQRKLSTVLMVQTRPSPPPRPLAQAAPPAPMPTSALPFLPAPARMLTPSAPSVPPLPRVAEVALLPTPIKPPAPRRVQQTWPERKTSTGTWRRIYSYRGHQTV